MRENSRSDLPSSRNASDSRCEYETKFVFKNYSAGIIINWLKLRCWEDPAFPRGIVSSIYFDTKNWRFLREKVNSDYLKTKVRVRWYADLDSGIPDEMSFLEAKYKIGSTRTKFRTPLSLSGKYLSHSRLDDPKILEIPHRLKNEGIAIPGPLFPVFQVSFKRRRFIEPKTGSRLSIDYDICVPKVNYQMIRAVNPVHLRSAVFEMKGNITDLPDVLHYLTALGCHKQSFSKYASCYSEIMQLAT